MSIESYRRDVERHRKELARLQQEKAREAGKAADESKRAASDIDSANRTSSLSTAQSRLKSAQRHEEAAVRHQKKVAELEAKIAREQSKLHDDERRLAREQQQQDQRRAQEQQRFSREQQRKFSEISGRLQEHDQLHDVALSAIEKLQQLPQNITVVFLAANPLDQEQLRLDEEVRAIGDMIRRSKHRDAVQLESRWAVRPLDVLQAINECQPTIVHFSGHGSNSDEIVFQDDAGRTKLVSKDAIAQTMAAASGEIQLVFFNTCYSSAQAEKVVHHVPAAIGMNTSIGDDAARIFSAQFYSAIGFGLPVGKAFDQAKAALMLESIPEESTPELFLTRGITRDQLILVAPDASE